MLFGLEKEFFVKSGDKFVLAGYKLPYDSAGILAEARGEPKENIIDAVYSLKAEIYKLARTAKQKELILIDSPLEKISKRLRLRAQRQYAKGLIEYQNIYGHCFHRNKKNEYTAGLHISITFPIQRYCWIKTRKRDHRGELTVNNIWDYVQFVRYMDKHFEDEIKNSKRNPGFYEIKGDGRIEYRSLPSNINLNKVIEVVSAYCF